MPRLLDAELLGRFESALRDCDVDVDDLTPGLTNAEIDRIVEPWGLQLPNEVRAWWRWRNGTAREKPVYLLPHRMMLNLSEAIWPHVDAVKLGRQEYADPEGAVQPVDWDPAIFVQCTASGNAPAPVYVVHDPAAPSRLVLASFGELVLTWIDLIERGIYARQPEGGWSDEQHYPDEIVELGLA